MADLPSVSYINQGITFPPSNQPYHLRRRNYLVPFQVPDGWHLVVEVDGVKTEDFTLTYSQLIINNPQPPIGSTVYLTIEEDEDEEGTA